MSLVSMAVSTEIPARGAPVSASVTVPARDPSARALSVTGGAGVWPRAALKARVETRRLLSMGIASGAAGTGSPRGKFDFRRSSARNLDLYHARHVREPAH